jgi:hypothetical protein
MKNKLANYIKNYERKDANTVNSNVNENKAKTKESKNIEDGGDLNEDDEYDEFSELRSKLPLPEGVLKVNLGIPIIVVGHKVDLMIRGDKAQLLESNIEFIQKHIRQYCLSYAATLMFTEVHQQTNLENLYRYLLHRLYDFEFV